MNRDISFHTPHGPLRGRLAVPQETRHGLILLAQLQDTAAEAALAADLAFRDYAVLSMTLLTQQELQFPDASYNVPLLARRLTDALDLLRSDGETENMPVGLFAVGHVTPAAIRAAARRDLQVRALACHGGIVDLAGLQNLRLLAAPLLMLVDAGDNVADIAFRRAAAHLSVPHQLAHPGPGENPAASVVRWFDEHLQAI